MRKPVEPVENILVEGDRSEEIQSWERSIFARQESAIYSVKRKQSLQARYIYGFIFFLTNLWAWFVRDYGHKFLHILHCVLRISLGCFIFFSFMFVTTFRAEKLEEARNSWHSRCWALKVAIYLLSVMAPFIIPSGFIQLYGEVAHIGAGIFLLLQLISMIHFLSWCDSQWMPDLQSKKCGFFGLFLSTIFYLGSFCGIVLMYIMYALDTSCTVNIFLIAWTAILVKVMMIVSLHSKVNKGLLSSGIMGSYIVFLCWSAIQSEPHTQECNTKKMMAEDGGWTTILSFLIAVCAIVMATFSTGIDTQSFQFCKDDIRSEDDVPYSYEIFHFIFAMGAMYFAMLFISWELDQPTRKWSIDVGWASTWVKIINEWFAASIYLWKLISPVVMRDKAINQEQHVQTVQVSV
ncbi:uncharacterized protein [Elaeis guineensis]|uniref:uncharacterized protein isoform X2 n=1 Tax=Elaeis guineensis var. tenera TaxID=51953 RepID=UPI003C6CE90A